LQGLSSDTDKREKNDGGQRVASKPVRGKKKKLTLDEFFQNMGKKHHSPPSSKYDKGKGATSLTQRIGIPPKRKTTDMASFFDQVDALMEKNKQSGDHKDISKGTPVAEEESLFDLLQPAVEEPSLPSTSQCYDNTAWQQYCELLEQVTEKPEFLKKHTKNPLPEDSATAIIHWLKSPEPSMKTTLPMLDNALQDGDNNSNEGLSVGSSTNQEQQTTEEQFRGEIRKQRQAFMAHHGWNAKQYNATMGALVIIGNLCAKACKAAPLEVAWQKLKEGGFRMDQKTLHNYLYVSSTFSLPSSRPLSSLTRRSKTSASILDILGGLSRDTHNLERESNKEKKNVVDVAAEVALCHDFLYAPSEQSTSIHVRILVSQGKPHEAEKLLDATTKNDDLRLRTYAPVFDAYTDQDDIVSALKLFVKMKHEKHTALLPETYVQLISCIAENGFFKENSPAVKGHQELGYQAGSGAALFNALASELAENSIEITSASAKLLYNSFQRGFKGEVGAIGLQPMHMLESFQLNNDPAGPNELIVSRVIIDEDTGKCARSRSQLRLIGLDNEQKEQFREGLLNLCSSAYQERHKTKDSGDVVDALKKFGIWLQERDGPPFTAICDGPNIAYYMQNFDEGRFSFHQIKFVVDTLEEMGENALVVLPMKYMQNAFPFQTHYARKTQRLRKEEREIRDDLLARGKIAVVPVGSLDDYYWMYASVSMQEEYVPPGNAEGRWPGTRPMLVSNDKLRDHKLSLLEPRLFRRWFSNFMVNFTFSAFVGGESGDHEIGFRTADFYSREIQCNPSLNENGEVVGTAWHFPISDWKENECLCIRIPATSAT
jgi:hypothetical protein